MHTRTTLAAGALLAAGLLGGLASPSPSALPAAAEGPKAPAKFEGGFPTPEAARRARDEQDLQRAITAYRFWYPTVSCEGIFNGSRERGIKDNEALAVLSAGPRQLAFTANSD